MDMAEIEKLWYFLIPFLAVGQDQCVDYHGQLRGLLAHRRSYS